MASIDASRDRKGYLTPIALALSGPPPNKTLLDNPARFL